MASREVKDQEQRGPRAAASQSAGHEMEGETEKVR